MTDLNAFLMALCMVVFATSGLWIGVLVLRFDHDAASSDTPETKE